MRGPEAELDHGLQRRARIDCKPRTHRGAGGVVDLLDQARGQLDELPLDDRTRASVALGERITDTGAEYTAWNVGVKRKLTDHLAADVRWYDTDQHELGERYEGRLVGALTYAF